MVIKTSPTQPYRSATPLIDRIRPAIRRLAERLDRNFSIRPQFDPAFAHINYGVIPGTKPLRLSDMNGPGMIRMVLLRQMSGGGSGGLEQVQRDVVNIVKFFVKLRGGEISFSASDIKRQYTETKNTQLPQADLEKILVSLEQLLYIRKLPEGNYTIYDQAKMIQDITTQFMADADRPEAQDLRSLTQLFKHHLSMVYTNADVYLYRDSTHDEAYLAQRTTGPRDLSLHCKWSKVGLTKKQMHDLYMRFGKIVREINLMSDEDFVDPVSREKDLQVFVKPEGSILSAVFGVKQETKGGRVSSVILGGMNVSNLTPKPEFAKEGKGPATIIGSEINPPLYGQWVIDKASIISALSNLVNQMAIRMNRLLVDSGEPDIRALWEKTPEKVEVAETIDPNRLKAFLSSLPGAVETKTFKYGDGAQRVKITSVHPASLSGEQRKLLITYLDHVSKTAFMQKAGVEVSGYGREFVEKHFLGVERLMLAFNKEGTEIISFAGINSTNIKVKLDSGVEENRNVWIVESVMVLPKYQSYGIGPHLMYKLIKEALIGNKMRPTIVALRTAVPRAYAAIWRAFPESLYPNMKKPLIDPSSATAEEKILLQIMQAASEKINPGNRFDPTTGVVDDVYSADSGLQLTPDRLLLDRKNPEANDFVAKLLGFDPVDGNRDGKALILYMVADPQAKKHYERNKAKTISSAIAQWFEDKIIKFLRGR